MKRLLFILFMFGITHTVHAGQATGQVATIHVSDNTNAVLFTLTAEISKTPRCNEARRFSINLAKPGGMASYMALLDAKKHNYEITVEGLNTCSNEWKSEDVRNILIH